MGKFDGILICSDLDDTLLTSDKQISDENKNAIEYFKSNGGYFTFATGRVVEGARLMLNYVSPNVPMVCFNGACIYDFEREKSLYIHTLEKEAAEVVSLIYDTLPYAAIDICTQTESCFCHENRISEQHKLYESLPDNSIDFREVTDEWVKAIFMTETNQLDTVKSLISESPFADKFEFFQSSPWYYEMLPKGVNKGHGLKKLAELLDIPISRTIGIGDNQNDIAFVKAAGVGIAVANAADEVKAVADCITVDNNSHALKAIIDAVDKGILF